MWQMTQTLCKAVKVLGFLEGGRGAEGTNKAQSPQMDMIFLSSQITRCVIILCNYMSNLKKNKVFLDLPGVLLSSRPVYSAACSKSQTKGDNCRAEKKIMADIQQSVNLY